MPPTLDEQITKVESDLLDARNYAAEMEVHGLSNTVHHQNIVRLSAALQELVSQRSKSSQTVSQAPPVKSKLTEPLKPIQTEEEH